MIENLKTALRRQQKLIALSLLTIFLPSALLSFFGIRAIRNERFRLTEQAEIELSEAADEIKNKVRSRIRDVEDRLHALAQDASFAGRDGCSPSGDTYRLWRVAASGGEPEDLHTEMIGEMRHLTVHPDGKRVAFKAQSPIRNAELWAIENVQK